jgi:hypothetical protein
VSPTGASSPRPLAERLLLRAPATAQVLGDAAGAAALGPLPDGVSAAAPGSPAAWVALFVRSQADLVSHWPAARAAVAPGGLLWVAYPKKSGPIRTDIHRDAGWGPALADDWHPVTQIAVDDTWSALRFRPRSEIKQMTRRF